jgi:hypothetical protein
MFLAATSLGRCSTQRRAQHGGPRRQVDYERRMRRCRINVLASPNLAKFERRVDTVHRAF